MESVIDSKAIGTGAPYGSIFLKTELATRFDNETGC